MKKQTILVVDDAQSTLFAIKLQLEEWGYRVLAAQSGGQALDMIRSEAVDLVLSDQEMPGMDGRDLLQKIRELHGDTPFIILTAHGSIDKAVSFMKEGADDYITKPFNPGEMQLTIERALKLRNLNRDFRELKEYLHGMHSFENIVTRSPLMGEALKLAEKVAKLPYTPVLIYGESGAGKEVLARAIHSASGCLESRFVAVNCAAIPGPLLESELFGHVRGAFTGAERDRDGKFLLARSGTILLDEIGDMPVELQAKLLRVLEEKTFEPVGSNKAVKAEMRLITATHHDLGQLVTEKRFREDLFHRINVFPIRIPALRERKEDIPLLVDHFMDQFRHQFGKQLPGISKDAMRQLQEYDWPGNIRELRNCLERAAILTEGELVRPRHIVMASHKREKPGEGSEGAMRLDIVMAPGEISLDNIIDKVFEKVLAECGNNKARAAELLKVSRTTFYRRNKKDSCD